MKRASLRINDLCVFCVCLAHASSRGRSLLVHTRIWQVINSLSFLIGTTCVLSSAIVGSHVVYLYIPCVIRTFILSKNKGNDLALFPSNNIINHSPAQLKPSSSLYVRSFLAMKLRNCDLERRGFENLYDKSLEKNSRLRKADMMKRRENSFVHCCIRFLAPKCFLPRHDKGEPQKTSVMPHTAIFIRFLICCLNIL
jgi:hypothetical protein